MYHGLTIVTEQNEPANGWQQLLHCDSITVTLTLLQFLLHVTTVRGFLSLFLALTWDQWIAVHTWGLCICVSSRQKEVIGRLTVTRTGPQWHQHRSTRPLHDCKHAKRTAGREDHNEKREKNLLLYPLPRENRDHRPALLAVERRQREVRTDERKTDARYYATHRRIEGRIDGGGRRNREKERKAPTIMAPAGGDECGGVVWREGGSVRLEIWRGGAFMCSDEISATSHKTHRNCGFIFNALYLPLFLTFCLLVSCIFCAFCVFFILCTNVCCCL